ncbi:hypothetical protein AB0B89_36140 [Sphaerisporangium sp. NPDC049002]|uniref:hypothetical protein n=1 Tax=Sphaerisporangium sp. NPDC049002 TaxID=3155392 RepID=UPI00340FE70E
MTNSRDLVVDLTAHLSDTLGSISEETRQFLGLCEPTYDTKQPTLIRASFDLDQGYVPGRTCMLFYRPQSDPSSQYTVSVGARWHVGHDAQRYVNTVGGVCSSGPIGAEQVEQELLAAADYTAKWMA